MYNRCQSRRVLTVLHSYCLVSTAYHIYTVSQKNGAANHGNPLYYIKYARTSILGRVCKSCNRKCFNFKF